MTRKHRIHFVGGLTTSLVGFAVAWACVVEFGLRIGELETTLETAEDVQQLTSAMQGLYGGASWVFTLGQLLIAGGFLYSLVVAAIWFVGPSERPTIEREASS